MVVDRGGAATVVGLVAAVVGGTVETVETDTGTVDDVLAVVVVFVVVDAA